MRCGGGVQGVKAVGEGAAAAGAAGVVGLAAEKGVGGTGAKLQEASRHSQAQDRMAGGLIIWRTASDKDDRIHPFSTQRNGTQGAIK
jgi:hypothetical protein